MQILYIAGAAHINDQYAVCGLYSLKMYFHAKMKFLSQVVQKLQYKQEANTCTHTHRQTDATIQTHYNAAIKSSERLY